jgi:hypothetical protein
MRLATAAAAAVLTTICGCGGGDPRAPDYVTSEPDRRELVGRYELITARSAIPKAVSASRDPDLPYSLTLRDDGTFTATNVPEFRIGAAVDRLVSASGTWKVSETGTLGTASGKRRRIWGVRFESQPSIRSVECMGPSDADRPERRLVFVLGDPDSGEGLTFGRAE